MRPTLSSAVLYISFHPIAVTYKGERISATLRSLLAQRDLELDLVSDPAALPEGWQDREIPWVHSSDLLDPTPFIADGHALLTIGAQFGTEVAPDEAEVRAYVDRLTANGLSALGFGTEVVRSGPPEALIAACADAALPLFIVPYRIPFIAVVQANARELAREANARATWALAAQRAIALAALRPDGLSATLAELSSRLDGWVALFDAGGALQREYRAMPGVRQEDLAAVSAEVARLLRRGQRASASVRAGERIVTLQSLGAGGSLRGVLALGPSEHLDQAGREVVTSVIAMAGLALEQNHQLDQARSLLRSGLLQLLVGGETGLVQRISGELWGPLPPEPVRVAVAAVDPPDEVRTSELLELWAEEHPGRLFFGWRDDVVVLCVPAADRSAAARLVEAVGADVGISDPWRYDDLPTALEQGLQALRRARDSVGGVVEFDEVARSGVLAQLARGDARSVARSVLAPLVEHDQERGTELVRLVRTWLDNECELDATARVLGIHRHTARARIGQAGTILGRDLSGFAARAELWATLIALG